MKFGCHAVMFGPKLATDMEETVKAIATTGFQGIECGNRFISLERRPELMKLLEENGLELGAIHFAFMGWRDNPEEGYEALRKEAEFMATTPNKNINFSFMPLPTDDHHKLAATFEKAAQVCAEYGVSLNYHNHLAEFANDGAFIHTLLEEAPTLHYAFDLGWAKRAGYDPIRLLKEAEGRCNYVHIRDPKKEVAEAFTLDAMRSLPPFPEFGEGETNLKEIVDFLLTYLDDKGWAIVEHEGGAPDAQRYVKAKAVLDALLKD